MLNCVLVFVLLVDWILRSRTRTSWIYPQTIKEAIQQIQKTAQISGDATELRSTYLVLTQEGH